MFKKYPFISRLGVFLLLPLALASVYGYHYLNLSTPKHVGEVTLKGLADPVNVTFDEFGTPNLVAHSDKDAYFAQGYLHASERMWQMEMQRRLVRGQMSEVFGKSTVRTDIWMRTLDLYGAATQAQNQLGNDAKHALQAYADGVNAWLAHAEFLPPEFAVFGLQPEPWEIVDSIAWQKAFALSLGQNMYGEILRASALRIMSPIQLQTFFNHDPKLENNSDAFETITNDIPAVSENKNSKLTSAKNNESIATHSQQFESLLDVERMLQNDWSLGEHFAGSNAWVVSGLYTASKLPIIANDPHLSIQQPSIWYAIQMSGDKLKVSGMSMAGIPGVILGRNAHIAWGATALTGDQQDLFILDIPLDNNQAYSTDAGYKNIEVVEHTINVKPESPESLHKKIKPVKISVRKTELGPIVTDAINNSEQIMALRWSALNENDTSYESFYQLQYAKDWNEFRTALELLNSPSLNFLYADKNGNIGSQVAGFIPKRGNGHGVLPLTAFSTGNYWQGKVDFEKLPMQFNPQSGIIVSANNAIDSSDDFFISHDWAPAARNKRITELLEENINQGLKFTNEKMVEIQLDQVDLEAKKLLTLLQQKAITTSIVDNAPKDLKTVVQDAMAELNQWNAEYSTESSAATIYRFWLDEIKLEVFSDNLDKAWAGRHDGSVANLLLSRLSESQLLEELTATENSWCNQSDAAVSTCYEELATSFYSAIRHIQKQTGSDSVEDWEWGEIHHVEYAHQQFGKMKLLESVFSKKFSVGGSSNTVNVANIVSSNMGGYHQTMGATFRQVFDMGHDDNDLYIISTGQSGHFLSDHYDDMMQGFMEGKIHNYKKENVKVKNNAATPTSEANSTSLNMTMLPLGE